jgi:hypothetical protein
MRQVFDILATCVYASGVAFVGYPWVYDLPLQKRVEFTVFGLAMILLVAVIQAVVRNRHKNGSR